MYSIQRTPFGYYVQIEGALSDSEAMQLRDELRTRLAKSVENYSAIVDLRNLVPPRAGGQQLLRESVDFAFATGMQRIAVIYNSPVVRDLVKQLAFLSGRQPVGRYIDASKIENAEQAARDYAESGIEPPCTTQKIRVISG